MKNIAVLIFVIILISAVFTIIPAHGQIPSLPELKELIPEALGKAKNIQEKADRPIVEPGQKEMTAASEPVQVDISAIEKNMTIPAPGMPALTQFGYEIFTNTAARFVPEDNLPVRSDYVIGPGDSFSVTLWGISEGVFRITVDREGMITLPKAGVVGAAGITYGELKNYLASVLRPYYQDINISVSMDHLRSIRVYVLGEVIKPGSYVLSSLSTTFNALYACGGPTKKGSLRKIKFIRGKQEIARIDLYDFLLYGNKKGDIQLEDGDIIFVPLIGNVVGVGGNINRPSIYEFDGSANLGDIIALAGGFMPTSYLNRIQLQRVQAHERKIVEDLNISKSNGILSNIPIRNMDLIQIFPIYSQIGNMIFLEGEVKYPGSYELKEGMRVSNLLPSIDSLNFDAYLEQAEIIRTNADDKTTEVIPINLFKLFEGDRAQNMVLKPMDKLIVYSEKKARKIATINGEVRIPGEYVIHEGERLSSLLGRAGGFTDKAFLFGAIFIRKAAQMEQQGSINKMIDEMERRIVIESSLKVNAPEEAAMIQERYTRAIEMLEKLKKEQAKGRIIVNMEDPERLKGTKNDIVLEDGDSITVPQVPSVVNVLGEVYDSNSMLYEEGKSASYYIEKVGGVNKNADRNFIYVIRADGSILSSERYKILDLKMARGDTIIVPQRIESIYDWGKWFSGTLDNVFKIVSTYALIHTISR